MKYKEYTEKRQDEFNKLPLFWAFSDKQFEEALAARGVAVADAREHVYRFGQTGGFYLKKDAPIIHEYFKKDRDAELRDIMNADAGFAFEAFEYEMYNHEYPINWEGDYDVATCFGHADFAENKSGEDYLREMGYNDDVVKQWYAARKKVINSREW